MDRSDEYRVGVDKRDEYIRYDNRSDTSLPVSLGGQKLYEDNHQH